MIININFIHKLKKENILILGLGKTGLEVSNFLFSKNIYNLFIYDEKFKDDSTIKNLSLLTYKPKKIIEEYSSDIPLNTIHRMIISPGFSFNHKLIKEAKSKKIPCHSEIEFSFLLLKPIYKIITITGSNGKTTSCYLLNSILNQTSSSHFICGNIEYPMISILEKLKKNSILIIEISSFMLENTHTLKSNISSILNVFPNHLNWHNNFLNYLNSKKKLPLFQTEKDYTFLNYDSPYFNLLSEGIVSNILSFSIRKNNDNIPVDLFIKNDRFYFKNQPLFKTNNLYLKGNYNLYNALVSIGISKLLNINNDLIKKGIQIFKGLPHRMEIIKKINNLEIINNSKSTNPISVLAALESIPNKQIILIVGGISDLNGFQFLSPIIQKKVTLLIIYGKSKNTIYDQIFFSKKLIVNTLKEAFLIAVKNIHNNKYILFSPGCLSFDQFSNYIERGEYFRGIVERYFI